MIPGKLTSEYLLARLLVVAAAATCLFGAWVLLRVNVWAGVALIGIGSACQLGVLASYAGARGRVKAPRPYLPPVGKV